jgi:hypothetical protein
LNKLKKKYTAYFLLIAGVLGGCGIFETRDPESPQTIRSTYFPPTSADIVIDNITYSIQEKNSENYSKSISEMSFQYIPDSKSLLLYEQIFSSWNQQSEKHYLDNLIAATSSSSSSVLFLDNERLTQINSDSALFQADYIFVFQHNRINVPKSARGNLNITLATDNNDLFYVRKWEDFRQNDSDFTWSEFKANFSF